MLVRFALIVSLAAAMAAPCPATALGQAAGPEPSTAMKANKVNKRHKRRSRRRASPIAELLPAPRPWLDQFAGQTVLDMATGLALVKARSKNVPKVGEAAPDFELRTPDGKQTIRLSTFRGKRPLVLIFGSFT